MKKAILSLSILLTLVSLVYALNIGLDVWTSKATFYDNESVTLNVNITNYELSLSPSKPKLIVKTEGKNYSISLGKIPAGETVSKSIDLGKFDAGTYRLEICLEHDFLGVTDRTKSQYQQIRVLPSKPIRMKTYDIVITSVEIPSDIEVNEEFTIKIYVNSSTDDGFVEYGILGEKSEKEELEEGEQKISEEYKLEAIGTYTFEVKAYAGKGETAALKDYKSIKFIVTNPEEYGEIEYKPIEIKEGKVTLEPGKKPERNLIEEVGCFIIGGCKGDLIGPEIRDIEEETDANKTFFTIIADDTDTGNSIIKECEININYGGWVSMSPADGNFSSVVENAIYTCESLMGDQVVMFRCTDEFGNIGYSSTSVIRGKVDVVIATMKYKIKDSKKLESAVNSYINALKNDNLIVKYIELDSEETEKIFNVRVKDTDSWEETKDVLDKIIYKIKPKYVLILGGLNIFPMPPAQTNSKIPFIPNSDDRYADIDLDGVPDIIIGRVPLRNPDDIADYLTIVSSLHGSTLNTKKLIIGDACGGSNCFLRADVDYTSRFVFGRDCEQEKDCLFSPPYCTGRGTLPIFPIPCSRRNEMMNSIDSAGFIIIVAHGDGRLLAAVDENMLTGSKILSGVQINNDLDFSNKVLMTCACFGGSIDDSIAALLPTEKGILRIPLTQASSTAMASIDKNAVVFIGNTRFGYGTITVRLLGDIYEGTQSGKTIGEAFLNMKKSRLKNSYSDWNNAVIYEIQLYGDPTLKVR